MLIYSAQVDNLRGRLQLLVILKSTLRWLGNACQLVNDKAYLTVKSRNKGATRNEWEYPISPIDARQMLETCSKSRIIEKTRYIVPGSNGLKWEIDEFHGVLEGLVLAEIELPTEDTPFDIPEFIDREVTGDPKYYNSSLATSV